MAKTDFLRTPEDGNQRVVDGNFKASKALFIPNYSGAALGLNGNTNEPGAIAFKDGSFYGYNGSTWGSLGGGGINLTSLSATAPVLYNNATGVFSLNFGNGLTNIGGVLSLGGTTSADISILAGANQFLVRAGTSSPFSDMSFSQTTGFHVTTATGAIGISSTGVGLGLGTSNLNFTPTGIVLADGLNATGIKYTADYSANYTVRSLIDKGYATSTFAPLLLTGYTSGSGTVSATDTVLQAIQKLNGNIASLTGGVTYKGTWNASTNTPTLTSSVGTNGFLYNVSVAGSTNLNGISTWNIGDQAIYNGTAWEKLPGTAISATAPMAYNATTGAVSLAYGNGLSNVSGLLSLGGTLTSAGILNLNNNEFQWVDTANNLLFTLGTTNFYFSAGPTGGAFSFIQIAPTASGVTSRTGTGSNNFLFNTSNTNATMGYSAGIVGSILLQYTTTGATFYDDIGLKGITYNADYSANFTSLSLINKIYADSHFGGVTLGTHDQILSVNTSGTASEFRTFNASVGVSASFSSGSLSLVLKESIFTQTDASFSITTQGALYKLPVITANRTITLPTGTAGYKLNIWNQNTTAFTWTFVTVVPVAPDGTAFATLANNTFYSLEFDGSVWVIASGSSASSGTVGTTTNAISFNNSGSGVASGSTFNGSAARTISYNTIGAAPLANPTFTGVVTIPTGAFFNTPASITLTNATGLPVGSITGLGTGVGTFLASPTSVNLAAAVTGETGTGGLVFAVSPTFTGTPTAPTASAGTLTTQLSTCAYVANALSGATQYFVTGTFVGSVDPSTPTPGSSGNAFKLGQVVGISNLTATGTASSTTFLRGDNTWATVSGGGTGANPTASVGLTAVNGTAITFLRSDGAPAISQAIVPTWTGLHTFNKQSIGVTSTDGILLSNTTASTSSLEQWSPALHFAGTYWTGSASAVTDWKIENQSSGTQGLLVFRYQNAGAGYNTAGYFSPGALNLGGLVNLNQGFFGATSTDVLLIQNQAAASSGTPLQKSGRIRFQGSVWNLTTTAAANYFAFSNEASGVSLTTPTGTLDWYGGIGTSTTVTLTKLMSLDAATGNLTLANSKFIGVSTLMKPTLAVYNTDTGTFSAAQMISGITSSAPAPGYDFNTPTASAVATALGGVTQGTRFIWTLDNSGGSGAIDLALGTGFFWGSDNGSVIPLQRSVTYLVVFMSSTTAMISQIV